MDFRARLRPAGRYLGSLAKNKYFWGGLALLGIAAAGLYLLVNSLLMPAYTQHGVAVTVPAVLNQPFEEAQQILARHDLRAERLAQRYNPDAPRDVVVEQNPEPQATVKPGRRVYLTINSGRLPMVELPSVVGSSIREAQNRLMALGLEVDDVRLDSIPSQYANTITRQEPAAGDSLRRGASVTLWYSKGLGEEYVDVPDVTGQRVAEAKEALLARKLRSVVVDAPEETSEDEVREEIVQQQSQEPGTRVREGFEIRLYVQEAEGEQGAEDEMEEAEEN